jgi:5'-3' exonuclease
LLLKSLKRAFENTLGITLALIRGGVIKMISRYVLVDYMHLAHRCIQAEPLSTTVNIGGELRVVDTTIPNYTIKNIYGYSGKGRHYTGVFLEGGASERKKYFATQMGAIGAAEAQEGYKGNRNNNKGSFYEGIGLTVNLLHNGQVSLYRKEGMEADDLIASVVSIIKSIDKITPIDIITNDSDMLPLVDDQVSVYMRGNRQWAAEGCTEHRLYYQVTPESWLEYLSYTSAYREYYIPYNSMLLFKLIRGDKADNVAGSCLGYGGKKYSALMQQMEEDGIDFAKIFRYGLDFDVVMRPVLETYFPGDMMIKDKDKKVVPLFDAEGNQISIVDYMKYIYLGISPKYANADIPKQIEPGYLQSALNPVKINIVK